MDATDKLANEIVRIVTDRWQSKGSPVFLAYLGSRLSPEAKAELRMTGMPLKKYIQLYLADRIRLFMIGQTADALAPTEQTKGLTEVELASRHVSIPRDPQFPRFMVAV